MGEYAEYALFDNRKTTRRMAKNTTKKFRGKAVYCKLYSPDEYGGKQFWKAGIAVTKEVAEEIKASGSQARVKFAEDIEGIDDGMRVYSFRRDCDKEFSDGVTHFLSPTIYDKDGRRLVYYKKDGKQVYQYKDSEEKPERIGEPVIIGNGSEIEVTVDIYQTKLGKGTRLQSVKIIDLIEYTPPEELSENEVEEEREEKVEVKKSKKEASLDDEIPFESKVEDKPTKKSKVGW